MKNNSLIERDNWFISVSELKKLNNDKKDQYSFNLMKIIFEDTEKATIAYLVFLYNPLNINSRKSNLRYSYLENNTTSCNSLLKFKEIFHYEPIIKDYEAFNEIHKESLKNSLPTKKLWTL